MFLARRRPFDELSVNPLSSQFSQTIMPDVAEIKIVLNTSLQGAYKMYALVCEYGLKTGKPRRELGISRSQEANSRRLGKNPISYAYLGK